MVFTSDGELLRCYHHDGCGHFDWFLKRVRDEAAAIETPWVFGATLPRPQPFWELLVDDDGNEIDEILRPPSSSRWTATWYAEARGGGVASTVAGCLHLDGEQVTCRVPLEVRETAATRACHRILYGHPARRRHSLRRSTAARDVASRRIR